MLFVLKKVQQMKLFLFALKEIEREELSIKSILFDGERTSQSSTNR